MQAHRESLTIIQRLAALDPANTTWQRDLCVSRNKVGDVLRAQGNLLPALEIYRESLTAARRLAASEPADVNWRRDLSVSLNKVGDLLRARGDLAGALRVYEESLILVHQLATANPANAGLQRDLWAGCSRMAVVTEQDAPSEARLWWDKAYEILFGMKKRGLPLSPEDQKHFERIRRKICA
jgi:tetratricopeptide (TPR) repeat protein